MIQATCMHEQYACLLDRYTDNIVSIPVPLLVVVMDDSELVPTLHCSDILW